MLFMFVSKGPVNVTRFCGWTPHTSYGCFQQKMGAGTVKEVCFCDGENCNSTDIPTITSLLKFIIILPILSFLIHTALPWD